jgi:hypothetical protein
VHGNRIAQAFEPSPNGQSGTSAWYRGDLYFRHCAHPLKTQAYDAYAFKCVVRSRLATFRQAKILKSKGTRERKCPRTQETLI